jgi:imidazole glycerol-phosphate synthase subunit HisH
MKSPKIAIIDYGMCNLFSVCHACLNVGLSPYITKDPGQIDAADGVILPGVGAFGDAMLNLQKLDLVVHVQKAFANKPFLGICLGLQLLFESSSEFGAHKGLDLIKGAVDKFPVQKNGEPIRIPQIGWNKIEIKQSGHCIFRGIPSQSFVYFIHSYFVKPNDDKVILTTSDYGGIDYCSGVCSDNAIGLQFHPEKSGKLGLQIYENWKTFIQTC